jgi:heme/copper-type cytochrome/quinol oxidase subunit 2
MIRHFLKVAFRNLWKYKYQTLVSVIGLAVGFACFAMATLWIRYEMTFDNFHKNADRMYCITRSNKSPQGGPYPLAGYLKETFPEIAHSTPVIPSYPGATIEVDGVKTPADIVDIDSSFFSMFDVKFVSGSMDFLIPESKSVAITVEKAKRLFGDENPIGKVIKIRSEYTVGAVVTGLPKQSNYSFDILFPMQKNKEWYVSYYENVLIELVAGVDVEAFRKKLYEHTVERDGIKITRMNITPLTVLRHENPNVQREVKFQHIVIFSGVGALLILCTLFNYLTLFISRFRMRQRELALRVVYGASGRSLFTLLSVEFLISLVIALLLGFYIIFSVIEPFRELSGVKLGLASTGIESLVYIVGIILIALAAFVVTLAIFRRRTLNTSIRRSNNRMFRRVSIVFQLVVSIVFAFCSIVILKQMYHLHNTDLGFAYKDRGSILISTDDDISPFDDKIRQIPEITETIKGSYPLLPMMVQYANIIKKWDDMPENAKDMSLNKYHATEKLMSYYEFQLVEGELLSDNDDPKYVVINESAKQAFGWHSAVGKSFNTYDGENIVKGVIKNIYNMSPTVSVNPFYYQPETRTGNNPLILFKYSKGTWKSCRKKIEEIVAKEYPNTFFMLSNAEEEYNKFLKSENTLLTILSLVSLVCVIVCVFGFVSIVALTCEERRKEIAIRKIHGATIKDILDIFFKEYLLLLIVGALIAFPAGYMIMKPWLENYVLQTEISAWIYATILLALIMAIVLCVGRKVYRTSRENPAETVKKF